MKVLLFSVGPRCGTMSTEAPDDPRRSRFASTRRGVSLLEVLISMFVMMVGLLGVASLLPVGQHSLAESAKADRAGTCGRAGLREVRARGILDPMTWVIYDTNTRDWTRRPPMSWIPSTASAAAWSFDAEQAGNRSQAYVIDPLYLAHNRYPTETTYDSGTTYLSSVRFGYSSNGNLPFIWRASLLKQPLRLRDIPVPPSSATAASSLLMLPAARRLFTFEDDLSFEVATGGDLRTRARVLRYLGTGDEMIQQMAYPIVALHDATNEATSNVRVLQPVFEGAYSWMYTVSPVLQEQSVPMGNSRLYMVSIVVFYRRNLDAALTTDIKPNERPVALNQGDLVSTSFGWGGGDLVLRTANISGYPQTDQFLETQPGEWLMVAATRKQTPSSTSTNLLDSTVFQWYRVVNTFQGPDPLLTTADLTVRYVTVVGPDWTELADFGAGGIMGSTTGNNGKPQLYRYPMAVLVTGVVGVYQMIVQLDHSTQWFP